MVFLLNFFLLAPFFSDCISEQDLDEMNIEIIRNSLYKVRRYLQLEISYEFLLAEYHALKSFCVCFLVVFRSL